MRVYSQISFQNRTMILWWFLFLFYLTSVSGYVVERDSSKEPESQYPNTGFECVREGAFLVPGTCDQFYLCKKSQHLNLTFKISKCPEGTIFDEALEKCKFSSLSYNCTRNTDIVKHNSRVRKKRFVDILGKTEGILDMGASFIDSTEGEASSGSRIDLSSFENKLAGIKAKIEHSSLQVLERQAEKNIPSQITRELLKEVLIQNQEHFRTVEALELKRSETSQQNFAKVQGNLEKIYESINQQVAKAKSEIQEGFASISHSANTASIPVVSELITSIKEFKQRHNHLLNLPDQNKKDEMERSGGYIDYLESAALERSLIEILYRNLAIPESSTDIFSIFILDLLCDGLQYHASILSSIVSSNMYLAKQALEEKNIENFNTYMIRVHSSILKMESNLGLQNGKGMINDIKNILNNVRNLPFISSIPFLSEVLEEKQERVGNLERELKVFAENSIPMTAPELITRRLEFPISTVPLPIGPWKSGKRVSYAVQYLSGERLSPVGEWSRPYEISDKAHPIVYLPSVEGDIIRLVYRKFDDGKSPELVGRITNRGDNSFRDIERDLINAVSRSNQLLAVTETKLLIENGADVNAKLGKSMAVPLHYAAEHNNVDVIRVLISKGADINMKSSDNMNALHFAASHGSDDALQFLLRHGADINGQFGLFGWSPLHLAVYNNYVEATKTLLKNNAYVNIKDNLGLTPLHVSILGNGETMDVLLNKTFVDVNSKDSEGLTPLHHAARSSSATFAKKLLQDYRTDVNALSNSRMSPLHYTAITGNVAICKLLIEHKASLIATDASGSTPLHYAAFYGNAEVAALLLEKNDSLSTFKTSKGHTALDLSNTNNNVEVSLILTNRKEVTEGSEAMPIRNFPAGGLVPKGTSHSQYLMKEPNCTLHTMEEIGDRSEEVCSQVNLISNYVQTVMSMIPVPVREESEEIFLDIKNSYNTVLREALTHVRPWVNGNSIQGTVNEIFKLVKNFDANFNKMYSVYLTRATQLSKRISRDNLIIKIRQEISELENDLQKTKATLALASSPVTIQYLQKVSQRLEQSLQRKKQDLSVDPLISEELEEFLYFLSEVVKDVDDIKSNTMNARQQIQEFQSLVNRDKQNFDIIAQQAMANLDRIQQQTIMKNGNLRFIQEKEDMLQAEVDGLRQEIKTLFSVIHEAKNRLREERKELINKYDRTSNIGYFAAVALGLINKFAPFVIPPKALELVDVEKQAIVGKWQLNLKESQEQEELIAKLITNKERSIMQLREEIIIGSRNSQALKEELKALNKVDFYLKDVTNQLPSIQTSTSSIIGSLQLVDVVFTNIGSRIQEKIEIGKSATTTAEKEDALKRTFEMLTNLQCNWKDSTLYVMNLRFCSINNSQL